MLPRSADGAPLELGINLGINLSESARASDQKPL